MNITSETTTGLFNLSEFKGFPIRVVNDYFVNKGWEMADCFNDYKWAWVSKELGKSIVAHTEIVADLTLGNEIVESIDWYDGIYFEEIIG